MLIEQITGPRRAWVARLVARVVLIVSAAGGPADAQASAPPLWTTDSIYSNVLGATRQLRIALPAGYDARENATERYPVLIVLDAHADIPLAATIANARAMGGTNSPAMPRLIIVGVETRNPSRFRDMTPPPVSTFVPPAGAPAPGGAPAFLQFLSTELRPYIAGRYRTQSTTILAGHSLTGSFAAWAFGQAPDFLMGVIALSPTMTWLRTDRFGGRQPFDAIAARTTPGRMIVVTGTAEGGLDSAAQLFVAALRARKTKGLVFEHERIPEVSHDHTAGPLGMVPGLRFIFRPVSLAAYGVAFEDDDRDRLATFSTAFDSTREAYLRGAREVGLPQRLPLGFLTVQGRFYQDSAMAPLLMRLCQEMIGSYPALWSGYECAGDAQMRLGRSAEAIANYRRAIDAARAGGDSAAVARLGRKAGSNTARTIRPRAGTG